MWKLNTYYYLDVHSSLTGITLLGYFIFRRLLHLRIYLTNLGKYNEGELVGLWLKLPYTDEELQTALKQIGIGEQYEESFITDCENDLGLKVDEHASLSVLNEVARCVDDLAPDRLRLLQAVIELESPSVYDMVDIIGRLGEYTLHPNIKTNHDLGHYMVYESGDYDPKALGYLGNFLDYERIGEDTHCNGSGGFTSKGWLTN